MFKETPRHNHIALAGSKRRLVSIDREEVHFPEISGYILIVWTKEKVI